VKKAGKLLKAEGLKPDIAYTSMLKRAICTLHHVLEEADLLWIPVTKAWQFNERHYGGLTGLNKAKTAEKFGEEQVMAWRRSYDIPPPAVNTTSEYHPSNDTRYSNLDFSENFTETLSSTSDRVRPYFEQNIIPDLKAGKTVILSAHGNSLRALVKHLDGIDESIIPNLNIPTGVPLVYQLDENMKVIPDDRAMAPLRGRYLGNQEEVKAMIAGVQGQTHATSSASTIKEIKARQIFDSRGNPTVEVDMTTDDGIFRASVPSGASTGAYEAYELRDGGDKYLGKGCLKAVGNVNDVLGPIICGMDPTDQRGIDEAMIKVDGTDNKSNLGANAILGISLAASKAGAAARGLPLYAHYAELAGNKEEKYTMPIPCFNVINGGSHAGNKLAFQEYFVIPTGATSFKEAMQIGSEVYHNLGKIIKAKFGGNATLIGDEGGFAPPCDNREGCELIMEAIEKAGYKGKCSIGLDVAASEFKVKGEDAYDLDFKYDGNKISGEALGELYESLAADYPIATIEDPFDEDDWENWSKFTIKNGAKYQVVGDDLTVTNPKKIERAIDEQACTALLLKVNQIGSITESIDAVKQSKQAGWGIMTSHRSGETEDTYIADLAVGLCTGQIKTGAPCRSERLAKYNQLLRIEEELGAENTIFAGSAFRTTSWMG